MVNALNKGIGKAQVGLRWDPSPLGAPGHDLDLIAAVYRADAPYGDPAYVVHFDSRSPDGTIALDRDSLTGQGLGDDEVMTLELDRLSDSYGRVLVGVVIQQTNGRLTFGGVAGKGVRVLAGRTTLAVDELAGVAQSTAATVAEFRRDGSGAWGFHGGVRGFDADPAAFVRVMGRSPS